MPEQTPQATPQPSLPATIQLRDVTEADLPIFFGFANARGEEIEEVILTLT